MRRVGAEGPRLWNGAVQPYVGGGVQAGLVSVEAAGAKAPLPRGRVVVETKRRRRMEWGSQLVGGLRLPPGRRLFAEARWGWQGGDRFVVAAGVLF